MNAVSWCQVRVILIENFAVSVILTSAENCWHPNGSGADLKYFHAIKLFIFHVVIFRWMCSNNEHQRRVRKYVKRATAAMSAGKNGNGCYHSGRMKFSACTFSICSVFYALFPSMCLRPFRVFFLFQLNNSIFSQPASTHIHRQTITWHTAHHIHVRIPNSTLTWSGFCLRHENPYSNLHNSVCVCVCVCSGWLAHWCDVDAAFLPVAERCSNSI